MQNDKPTSPIKISHSREASHAHAHANETSEYTSSLTSVLGSFATSYSRSVQFVNKRDSIFHHKNIRNVEEGPNEARLSNSLPTDWTSEGDSISVVQNESILHKDRVSLEYDQNSSNAIVNPESEPLLEKLQDDTLVIHEPSSSFYQTVFNAVNILMGIGLLSLPFALKLTGWVFGIGLMLGFSFMTKHTALILVQCLDYPVPPEFDFNACHTFGDFGELAFG